MHALGGSNRIIGSGHGSSDHEEISTARKSVGRGSGTGLVVHGVAGQPDPRHPGKTGGVVVGLFEITDRTHDPAASRLGRKHDPLRHDVRRRRRR